MVSFLLRLRRLPATLLLLLVVGCLLASAGRQATLKVAAERLKRDFHVELRRRGIEKNFSEYQQYVVAKVQKTQQIDKARIPWIEHLVNGPLDAPVEAEQFTGQLYAASMTDRSLLQILELMAARLSSIQRETNSKKNQADERTRKNPFLLLSRNIHAARGNVRRAFSKLSGSEINELREKLFSQTTAEMTGGHRFGGSDHGARIVDLLLRVDTNELLTAGRHLAELTESDFVRQLDHQQTSKRAVLRKIPTPDGMILIGGDGPNVYHLDESPSICAVVDFGGDDIYVEGSVTADRPVVVIIDLKGNDIYRGRRAAIQGSALLGASLLFDRAGNDTYEAIDLAQGSSLAGTGILLDEAGDDSYTGDRRVQGQATAGFGILIDRSGRDRYRAALLSQGVGGPLGAGLLVDQNGNDTYFAGGKYPNSYHDSPGFASWSQGLGMGARDVANGGVGVLLDGSGNDLYEADYFSHGGGYWFGAGFARDFQGDDQRVGAVRTNFDRSMRTEQRYLRWGIGFGCHYAAGFVLDDHGNDSYQANWASIAYGWDVGLGMIFDGEGNDRYHSTGSGIGEARNIALSVLFDMNGSDHYSGAGLGKADQKDKQPAFSFALLQDRGGKDTYSQPVKNHSRAQRGWAGGILLDR
jgi:hypothetical protein